MNSRAAYENIYLCEYYQRNIPIEGMLSFPYVIADVQHKLASFVYVSDLYAGDSDNIEVLGFFASKDESDDYVEYNQINVSPIGINLTPFNLLKKIEFNIQNKQQADELINMLYDCYDVFFERVFCAKDALTETQIASVKKYMEILYGFSSDELLRYYYTLSPTFFDWCIAVIL